MKVLVIPDVHLKPWMFEKATKLMANVDRAVCLMDIPDDWACEYNLNLYEKTFDSAVKFHKDFPDTLWCYGNHDKSYIWRALETGYSPMARDTVLNGLSRLEALTEPKYIQRIDNVLFLHGGLTQPFVKFYVPNSDTSAESIPDLDTIIETINGLGYYEMWDDSSPLWYRPQHGWEKMYGEEELLQVVGHTPVHEVYQKGNVLSCDVFSTYRDGHPIGTEKFPVIDTKTREWTSI